MTQQIINYGAAPNDGTGDPLRTAFIKTDDNFDQIWAAGPVGSNITIINNTVGVTNTNGNLILSPNGIGVVQVNNHVVPRANRVYDLGSSSLQYRAVYANAVNATALSVAGDQTVSGDLTVAGNLIVEGDTIQIGNITTDTKTIQLSNSASNAAAANLSGVTVGANDNIATLLYNNTSNTWTTNIGVTATGNITAPYLFGNAAFVTGLPAPYGNSNVAAFLAAYGSNALVTTGNVTAGNLTVSSAGNTWTISDQYIRGPGGAYWHSHPEQQQSEFVSAPGEFISIRSVDGANVTQAELYLGNTYTEIFVENGVNHRWRFDETGQLEAAGDIIPVTSGSAPANIGTVSNPWTNAQFSGNVTANYFVGNGSLLTGVSNYANANAVSYAESGWSGNIIPSANAVYSLGNASNQWSNLWVANNTIYLGGVPLGMTAGNVLTVDGQDVITTNANGTVDLANLAVDNNNIYNTQGQGVVISNFSFIDEAETAYVQIPAGNSDSNLNIVQTQGNVRIAANAAAWLFDDTGNLTLPTNGSIVVDGGDGVIGPVSDDMVISWDNEEIRLVSVQGSIEMQADNAFRVQTNYDGPNVMYGSRWEFSNNELVNISNDFGIVSEAGNLTLSGGRDGVNSGNTTISAVNVGVAVSTWTFDKTGNLTLPSEGNIVGVTPNNAGRIQWVGNSSGDGFGYTTLGLIPDDTLVGNDQYLIIDPTAPGHIHIRAGGEQDNSNADLFLGGENSYFKVNAGPNNEVRISANSWPWTFGADGTFTLPANAELNGSKINSVANSSGDGAGYTTLQLVPDVTVGTGTDQYVIIDPTAPGHIHIRAGGTQDDSSADLILGGENSHIKVTAGLDPPVYVRANNQSWTFTTDGVFQTPGDISVNGNVTANYFIGDGSQLTGLPASYSDSNVATFLAAYGSNTISTTGNITAGNFIGAGSNVELVAQSEQWVFDTTGVLTVPGNITGANVVSANTFVSNAFNVVTAGNLSITSQYGLGFTGTILEDNGTLELIANGGGGVVLGWDSTYGNGLGNIATVNFNEVGGGEGNILLRTGDRSATEYNWNFDSTGNLTLPTAGYLLVQTGIIGAGASPAPTLSGFSSIATTGVQGNISASGNLLAAGYANITGNVNGSGATFSGNVTAQNFVGNISITGNVTGTTPNVTLIAGSYSWTFDNTGIASLPAVGGDEGGEINFGIPTANTTLTGPVKVDVYRDQLRFFDGSIKGAYLDLANCPGGVSTAIGYRDIPQISFTGNTTTVANAAGRHYYSTQSTDYVLTIANNTSVGWSVGTAITIVNRGTGNMTIAQGTGVSLYLAGNSTAGNRTVTTYGMATLLNVAANVWMINGTGVV